MKQSTIKLILGLAIILGLLSSLTSCSTSGTPTRTSSSSNNDNDTINANKPTWVTLRGVVLGTGITVPLEVLRTRDVYKIGDTVWVYQETNRIVTGDPMVTNLKLNSTIYNVAGTDYILFRARVEEVPYERFPSK